MRRLSSQSTFFHKLVLPIGWAGGFTATTINIFLRTWRDKPEDPFSWLYGALFLLVTVGGGWFLYYWGFRLKVVWLADDSLWVSNYLFSTAIPLDEVKGIKHHTLIRPSVVTIVLKGRSKFGDKILFMPAIGWKQEFSRAEGIVYELKSVTRKFRRNIR